MAAGVCVTGCFTLWETSLQEHVPGRSLSRVSSYDYLTSTGLIPLGNLHLRRRVVAIGLHRSLFTMSALGVAAALAVVAVPAVRHLPRATADPRPLTSNRSCLAGTTFVQPLHERFRFPCR